MKHDAEKLVLGVVAVLTAVVPLVAQTAPAQRPSFDAASIKPHVSGNNSISMEAMPGGRFVANNATLKQLIRFAYRVFDSQIFGGDNWITTEHYDIEAKAGGARGKIPNEMSPFAQSQLVQSLLEERFHLMTHSDMREVPVFELVVAKSGLKIKPSADQSQPAPTQSSDRGAGPRGGPGDPPPRGSMRGRGSGSIIATAMPLSAMFNLLVAQLGRPIIDKTGHQELFDFKLEWVPASNARPAAIREAPPSPADDSGPSIFTAMEEQLGLKLESKQDRLEVIVIDSVQRPSEN